MRKNITIRINTSTSKVVKTDGILGISGENLQGNLIFELDEFISGQAYIEVQQNSTKSLIPLELEDNKYILPIRSSLLICDMLNMNFMIYETSSLEQPPVFKSEIMTFRVARSVNAVETIEDNYPNILDIVNSKQDKLIAGHNIIIEDNVISVSDGSIGGTSDYLDLNNKPKINDIELVGNKSLDNLGIQHKGNYANTRVTNLEIDNLFN